MSHLIKFIRPFHKKYFAPYLSKRRINFIDELSNNTLLTRHSNKLKLLEVGCAGGYDLIKHLKNRDDMELYGMDLRDFGLRQDNFKMIVGNANKIDYPDKFFDMTISLGVLEHIQPIEELSKVVSEINRVSKSYYIDVPAISTVVESHTNSFFWQLRDHNKKSPKGHLNYFSDEAWLQFSGFIDAKVTRFNYIPFLMKSLFIYKNN